MALQFDYYVEIRDMNGSFVNRLSRGDNLFLDFKWGYDRVGGCGRFQLDTKHSFDNPPPYAGGYDLRLYILNVTTSNYDLWFRGEINQVNITLSEYERSEVSGNGYVVALSRLTKNGSYITTEVSAIVKDILDNIVTPNTSITYDVGDIVSTGFTIDAIAFNNTTVMEAFETLADIAGAYEWGVGSDLKFFFKPRSTTPSIYVRRGINILSLNWASDYNQIVNTIQLEGGETGGSKYTRTVTDAPSVARWGKRERIMQNASITTDAVADQYGASILAEQSGPLQRGALVLHRDHTNPYENTPIESTVPLGTIELQKEGVVYGSRTYGTFLYGGNITFQVLNIQYGLDDNGVTVSMNIGRPLPSLAVLFKQISFDISQTRQRSV